MPNLSAVAVLFLSAFGIGTLFAFYPLFLRVAASLRPRPHIRDKALKPSVTVVTVVRNGSELIEAKIANTLAQDYPSQILDIIIFSDGSTDGTAEIARNTVGSRGMVLESKESNGKAHGLNCAAEHAAGEVLVFSDTDAELAPDAISALVANLADPDVGGVVGRRTPKLSTVGTSGAQTLYADADSSLKQLETATGSVTANDGKLYAIRKRLFSPIASDATDDLFCALSIIKQGYRFVYDAAAVAKVSTPSKDAAHEIDRRRRIVCRSLTGIRHNWEVLNFNKFGTFSVGLFINKICRRLLPVFLLGAFCSSALLAAQVWWGGVLFSAQVLFYALGMAHPIIPARLRFLKKAASVILYFTLGNIGTLLGTFDFIIGKRVEKWEPRKIR